MAARPLERRRANDSAIARVVDNRRRRRRAVSTNNKASRASCCYCLAPPKYAMVQIRTEYPFVLYVFEIYLYEWLAFDFCVSFDELARVVRYCKQSSIENGRNCNLRYT